MSSDKGIVNEDVASATVLDEECNVRGQVEKVDQQTCVDGLQARYGMLDFRF